MTSPTRRKGVAKSLRPAAARPAINHLQGRILDCDLSSPCTFINQYCVHLFTGFVAVCDRQLRVARYVLDPYPLVAIAEKAYK
ncbi:hypothetical protein J6590_030306 [Homalodisca vitripennis]|nr:hypothetical protein J6590_030306 [Homalodisca vitripennis]